MALCMSGLYFMEPVLASVDNPQILQVPSAPSSGSCPVQSTAWSHVLSTCQPGHLAACTLTAALNVACRPQCIPGSCVASHAAYDPCTVSKDWEPPCITFAIAVCWPEPGLFAMESICLCGIHPSSQTAAVGVGQVLTVGLCLVWLAGLATDVCLGRARHSIHPAAARSRSAGSPAAADGVRARVLPGGCHQITIFCWNGL